MVARSPDDRPDLLALVPCILKPLRRRRNMRPAEMARQMGMSVRAFENFENGKGRLNVERIHQFAALLNVDPFAILTALEIRSPAFAIACADNKLAMIDLMALEDAGPEAHALFARVEPLAALEVFKALYAQLTAMGQAQEALVARPRPDEPQAPQEPETGPETAPEEAAKEDPDSEPE